MTATARKRNPDTPEAGDRLPEEQPGTPWDVSRGARVAMSVFEAEASVERRRRERPLLPPPHEMSTADKAAAARITAAALAAASQFTSGGSLEARLRDLVSAYKQPEFVEQFLLRLRRIDESGGT